ncbi:hypothetical protein [Myroides odoratimimus]|uniref:hypothetical protein n=1 Tax=Myroides odoratimimus TaxID=76832 RepID=UPI002DBB6B23|nr:hypothetical protein [Myroides odoratimimus]MEC4036566.1 hypothetical protein [Myroides odoratimimus]
MSYKVLYIEDLEPDTRTSELNKNNDAFKVTPLNKLESVDQIISQIKLANPDLIIFDYILTEGESQLRFSNAPSLAQTLRSLTVSEEFSIKEIPLVLMSTKHNIVSYFKKDYTSHDLFDYAVSKDYAVISHKEKFIKRCVSFIKSYEKIRKELLKTKEKERLCSILDTDNQLLDSRIEIMLSQKCTSIYQYSKFIHEHLIRCSGVLIGEDILSARLGVSKESNDWAKFLTLLENTRYTGVFSDSYTRFWMAKIDDWWNEFSQKNYSLKHYDANERLKIIKSNTGLDLVEVNKDKHTTSSHYWTICQETKLPLDPVEGLELLDEDIMPWQDRNFVSIDGYLSDIKKYSKMVSELDRKEMRNFG